MENFLIFACKKKNRKRSCIIMTTHKDCFIAYYKDFLKIAIKDLGLNKINSLLLSDCFHSSGFDSDTKDKVFSCIKTNFDKQNINNFRFCCQRIILESFSEELHRITNMS